MATYGKGIVALLLGLGVAAAAPAQDTEEKSFGQRELEKAIESMPILKAPTTPEVREKQRAAGQRVMLVEAKPGYVYRDFAKFDIREGGRNAATTDRPQENPDVYGCVTVSFDIRPDGQTDGFEVVKAEPAGLFDKHALRAVYATEYEPVAAGAAPAGRQQRSIFFLVARPPRSEISRVNEAVEDSRNKRREERRAACEGA